MILPGSVPSDAPRTPEDSTFPSAPGRRRLIIVARDRLGLYRSLSTIFHDSRSVRVILDRRRGQDGAPSPLEAERRVYRVDEQLRLFGWSMVLAGD